jgi:hypothetical protein
MLSIVVLLFAVESIALGASSGAGVTLAMTSQVMAGGA